MTQQKKLCVCLWIHRIFFAAPLIITSICLWNNVFLANDYHGRFFFLLSFRYRLNRLECEQYICTLPSLFFFPKTAKYFIGNRHLIDIKHYLLGNICKNCLIKVLYFSVSTKQKRSRRDWLFISIVNHCVKEK